MLEIGTSGLMSGERKRVAQSFGWIPRLSSTLPHFRTLRPHPRSPTPGPRPPSTSISMKVVPRYAAIDIGSNSIRMEAAEVATGQPTRVLASDREVTRLGESVFRAGAVSEDAMAASCAVLARMAALYRKLDVVGVRAVATSAIRDTDRK